MRFEIAKNNNRAMYTRAKKAFMDSGGWHRSKKAEFWELFGKANNMKVIISEWKEQYPVVEELEFNTEADYTWFLLKYS